VYFPQLHPLVVLFGVLPLHPVHSLIPGLQVLHLDRRPYR